MTPKSIDIPADLETARRRVGDWAASQGFEIVERELQHGISITLRSQAGKHSVVLYHSTKRSGCRLVFEEPQLERSADLASALGVHGADDEHRARSVAPRVGADESGKGDYFGPVVTCAAFVDSEVESGLRTLGVRDSKELSDYEMGQMAPRIREMCRVVSVVVIDPERYNQMHDPKRMNVNAILAGAHRSAISEVIEQLESAGVDTNGLTVVLDQFANQQLMLKEQSDAGWNVRLVQMHRAESDVAVAAASILARVEFITRLNALSRDAGIELVKGAGAGVDATGRELVRRHGPEVLNRYAKHHFKNTNRLLQGVFAG